MESITLTAIIVKNKKRQNVLIGCRRYEAERAVMFRRLQRAGRTTVTDTLECEDTKEGWKVILWF